MKTPIAKTKTFELEKHGNVRIDPYYWLRDRENPEVIDYVKAENDWTDHIMSPTKELQKSSIRKCEEGLRKMINRLPISKMATGIMRVMKKEKNMPFIAAKKRRWMTQN